MEKEGMVQTYNRTLLSHKKNEILPFTTCMFQCIMLSEISQRRLIASDFSYMWNLKPKTKQNQTHWYRPYTDGCQMGEGGQVGETSEGNEEVQIASCKISHCNVRHSTGHLFNNILVTMCDAISARGLSWWSLHNVYKCLITMAYTRN